jgi:hypothetical protein
VLDDMKKVRNIWAGVASEKSSTPYISKKAKKHQQQLAKNEELSHLVYCLLIPYEDFLELLRD